MNSLLDSDDDLHETKDHGDREISLGTTMLLGIFFGLALICAVFFGLGYSMGRKSVQGASGVASNASNTNFGSFKPAPGRSTLDPLGADKPGPAVTVPYTAPPAYTKPVPVAAPVSQTASDEPAASTPAPITRVAPSAASPTAAAPVAATPVAAPAPGAISAMVQIAAVTHQEDADYLVSALKRRGYSVAIHTSPQDKFLHVQVGPFNNKKDAEAMKAKLLSDGFNAIVK